MYQGVKVSMFVCTCCHVKYTSGKHVILFKKQNYDFENNIVREVLHTTFLCKKSSYEYIYQNYHKQLCEKPKYSSRIQECQLRHC